MDTNTSNTPSEAPSDGPAAFLSQPFSAATEMILKRLRGEGGLVNHDLTSGLQASSLSTNIPGYDDVRRSVMNSMRTSSAFAASTPTPTPSVLGKKSRLQARGSLSGTPASKRQAAKAAVGKKKKRKMEESEEEESDSLSDMGDSESSLSEDEETAPASFPAVTQSGRKVVRPSQFVPEPAAKGKKGTQGKGKGGKKGGNKVKDDVCVRCSRGHSPKTNMIVFCDGCDRGWHQMCHDPMIRDEVVKEEDSVWYCSGCTEKREEKNKQKAEKEAESRRRSQNSTPSRPLQPEQKGWEEMSEAEKRQHLSSMPHYHLVDLLITAKSLFPSIPIAPLSTSSSRYLNGRIDDRRTNIHRQQPFPPSAAQGLFSRADANPSGQLNYIRKVPPGSTLPMSNAAMSRQNSGTPRPGSAGPNATSGFGVYQAYTPQTAPNPSSVNSNNDGSADAPGESDTSLPSGQTQEKPHDEEEEDDSPPPSPPYPKPGNGLMSRLKNDDQDLEWLVGNEREGEAFSHLVFEQDGAGAAHGQNNIGMGGNQGGNMMGGMGGSGMMMS